MYSALSDAALPAPGFPIRRSAGQRLFSASPRLIAAVHVLLRLLVPRHPPCALTILTVSCSQTECPGARLLTYLFMRLPDVKRRRKERLRQARVRQRRNPFDEDARPSAVFKVHGGARTGVSRRRL